MPKIEIAHLFRSSCTRASPAAITWAGKPRASGRRSQTQPRAAGTVCRSCGSHRSSGRRRRAKEAFPRLAAAAMRRKRRIHRPISLIVATGTTWSSRVTSGGNAARSPA